MVRSMGRVLNLAAHFSNIFGITLALLNKRNPWEREGDRALCYSPLWMLGMPVFEIHKGPQDLSMVAYPCLVILPDTRDDLP